jgi:hypothetical protein
MSFYSNIHCDFADRAFEIQNAHGSLPLYGVGMTGLGMYTKFLEGQWSLVMIHIKDSDRIHVRYMPRELTQFLFDAYGS